MILMRKFPIQITAFFILLPFMASAIIVPSFSFAGQELILPPAGAMVQMSSGEASPIIRGLKINTQNPFDLDFIIDQGTSPLSVEQLNTETQRMVKYFLAILTIPQGDLWVNLSPYEKQRISTDELGITAAGRDMLAQDYLLKQLTASLTHPETKLGKKFWHEVYQKAQEIYGNTQIKVNTFNKVWIVPDRAVVYQKDNTVFIVESHLRVMMEEDYLALSKNVTPTRGHIPEGDVSPSTLPSELGLNLKAPRGTTLTPNQLLIP